MVTFMEKAAYSVDHSFSLFFTICNYTPANCVCERVYCVRVCVHPSVTFCFHNIIDGNSSNLAYIFIYTGQILMIKARARGQFCNLFAFVFLNGF